MEKLYKCLCLTFLIYLTLPHLCSSLYFEEVENLTPAQRRTLDKFRDEVSNILPHEYMKEDLYLSRFLRAKNFRLRDSVAAIKETMDWRKQNNMDNILNEDFSDLEDYKIHIDGLDKNGRVILESNFGDWQIRKAVLAGKLEKLKRSSAKAFETATMKLRELQAEGKNATQWVLLSNFDGYSAIETACPACMPYYLHFVNTYEKHFPFTAGNVLFVNTPSSFEIVLSILRPLMNVQSRRIMKVFGADEKQWRPYLEEHFDYEQIGTSFGGRKVRKAAH